MKISELKERKRELGYTNKMIADKSGVPLSTVQKIFGGATCSPRFETLKQIEKALFPEPREFLGNANAYYTEAGITGRSASVRESSLAYIYNSYYGLEDDFSFRGKSQGEYTVDDYMALPDDIRVELIDGVLYNQASPTTLHQILVSRVFMQIAAKLDAAKGDCAVFISPLDVQFEADDDRTVLQPDMLIVCNRDKYINDKGRIIGTPDMVMEVLSPSTMGRDQVIKFDKYWQEGVREYWTVDTIARKISVYHFEKGYAPKEYSFADTVPLGIFSGKISVDFSAISGLLNDKFADIRD